MDDKIYWFITVFEKIEKEDGRLKTGATRCWGFYTNKEDALRTVIYNCTDLWETIYNYAVIEPYYEGVNGYCFDEEPEWFKFNQFKKEYRPIIKPDEVKGYVGFAIG